MDAKTAKKLTEALEGNTKALQEHTRVMTTVLRASGKPAPQTPNPPAQASPFTNVYGG